MTLYVVAAGFAALVVWQVTEALLGHRDEDGAKRAFKRVASAGKAGIYGSLGIAAAKLATGASKSSGTDSWTARLIGAPGGTLLVAGIGAAILVVAGFLAYRGLAEKFRSKLDGDGNRGADGTAYVWLGKLGYLAKAAALVVVGILFLRAAWTHDPEKSGGLDQALQQVLQQPFGPALLVGIAVGFAGYGLFCFAWARHLDR